MSRERSINLSCRVSLIILTVFWAVITSDNIIAQNLSSTHDYLKRVNAIFEYNTSSEDVDYLNKFRFKKFPYQDNKLKGDGIFNLDDFEFRPLKSRRLINRNHINTQKPKFHLRHHKYVKRSGSRELRWASRVSSIHNLNFTWPVKKISEIPGDIILGGLMMVHEREDSLICGQIMPQGGIQALECMLYTIDWVNNQEEFLPGISLGSYILDDCDKDTYGKFWIRVKINL